MASSESVAIRLGLALPLSQSLCSVLSYVVQMVVVLPQVQSRLNSLAADVTIVAAVVATMH